MVLNILSGLFDKVYVFDIETRIQKRDLEGKDLRKDLKDNVLIKTFFLNKKSPTSFFYVLRSLKSNLKKTNPAYIVLGGAGPHTNALFAFIARLVFYKEKKIVAIEQENSRAILKNENIAVRLIAWGLFRKIDRIIAPSRELINDIALFFRMSHGKFDVIYNFVDIDRVRELKTEPVSEREFHLGKEVIATTCD